MDTPLTASKYLTPCRRVGLSRKYRSDSTTPLNSADKSETPVTERKTLHRNHELTITPLCPNKILPTTGKNKRMTPMIENLKLKKKKLSFNNDLLNSEKKEISCSIITQGNKLINISENKENKSTDLSNDSKELNDSQISESEIIKLEQEISEMKNELRRIKENDKEIKILKSLKKQWKNSLIELLEILSCRTDPPEEFSNILKLFNISPDLIL